MSDPRTRGISLRGERNNLIEVFGGAFWCDEDSAILRRRSNCHAGREGISTTKGGCWRLHHEIRSTENRYNDDYHCNLIRTLINASANAQNGDLYNVAGLRAG